MNLVHGENCHMELKSVEDVRPRDLIRRARSNLIRATQKKPPGVLREDLCFNAHQAAEMALKAVHVYHDISYRFAHDLGDLLCCLRERGFSIPASVEGAARLSRFALPVLSPGSLPPEYVSREEHEEAVQTAREVLAWAREVLED